jgi:hypothetical protein
MATCHWSSAVVRVSGAIGGGAPALRRKSADSAERESVPGLEAEDEDGGAAGLRGGAACPGTGAGRRPAAIGAGFGAAGRAGAATAAVLVPVLSSDADWSPRNMMECPHRRQSILSVRPATFSSAI